MQAPRPQLDCATTIQRFLTQEMGGLRRLKELLPVYFDVHQVYALETQREILRACNLVPIQEGFQVTFRLETTTEPQATLSALDHQKDQSSLMIGARRE